MSQAWHVMFPEEKCQEGSLFLLFSLFHPWSETRRQTWPWPKSAIGPRTPRVSSGVYKPVLQPHWGCLHWSISLALLCTILSLDPGPESTSWLSSDAPEPLTWSEIESPSRSKSFLISLLPVWTVGGCRLVSTQAPKPSLVPRSSGIMWPRLDS